MARAQFEPKTASMNLTRARKKVAPPSPICHTFCIHIRKLILIPSSYLFTAGFTLEKKCRNKVNCSNFLQDEKNVHIQLGFQEEQRCKNKT